MNCLTELVFVLQEYKRELAKSSADAKQWQDESNAKRDGGMNSAPAAGNPRVPRKMVARLDVDAAKIYKPPGKRCALWHEIQTDRVRISYHDSVRTRSYSQPVGTDVHKALLEILRWAWRVHVECGFGECPWPELRT